MRIPTKENTGSKETTGDDGNQEQKALLKAFIGTVRISLAAGNDLQGGGRCAPPGLDYLSFSVIAVHRGADVYLSIGVATANQIPIV